jgi:LDH2 family malate/lactate/ureidoglycolate dehydrogenase
MEHGRQARRVPLAELQRFISDALLALNVARDQAAVVARAMADADLRGIHTHGVALLPVYAGQLRSGGFNPRPQVRVVSETASAALVDGDGGMGHLVGVRAMEIAVRKARDTGAAWVGVRASRHWGAAAHYACMALEHDMIGLALTAGAGNCMCPWGGLDILVGNNPLAIAVPAGQEPPVVLDMATSVVARGKIAMAAKAGGTIPPGWALDSEGRPTIDAGAAYAGSLIPIGGYKGYGLALMIALLTGGLTGGAIGSELTGFFDLPCNNPHLLGAIRVDTFMPAVQFRARVDWYVRELKRSRRAEGVERIYVPGEIEHETAQRQLREGIGLPPVVEEDVRALAGTLNVLPPQPLSPAGG